MTTTTTTAPARPGAPLTRAQAVDAYRRVRAWSERASRRVWHHPIAQALGDQCSLHNAKLAAEAGRPWPELVARFGPRYDRTIRALDHAQTAVWHTADRLATHFARFF